ncbi:hypothetical protein [Cellulomonas taurus]|uniref:hypothetical protein n=1 Tax=Cellulomonas taurus TaxID=2729175 RepID=UPI00145E2DFD|nr:hypothetical protein [Cellulomonas taurus]
MTTEYVRVRVRHDATDHMAPYADQVISGPMPRDQADQIIRAMPNGGQMELIPADTQHDDTKENDQ